MRANILNKFETFYKIKLLDYHYKTCLNFQLTNTNYLKIMLKNYFFKIIFKKTYILINFKKADDLFGSIDFGSTSQVKSSTSSSNIVTSGTGFYKIILNLCSNIWFNKNQN